MAAKPIRKKDKKGQCKSEENPWAYQYNLQLLSEADKLTKDELLLLTCRDKYCIKSVMFENPKDQGDELYRIFGDMVGQTVEFMRCWLRVHVLICKHQIAKFAKDYLDSKGLDISTWLTITADEELTLSQLLNTGLQKPNVAQTQKKASASARSESDLDRVKRELAIPIPATGRRAPHNSRPLN